MLDSLMMIFYLFARPHGEHAPDALILKSSAFKNHHIIPRQYTCYGKGKPLPLSWQGLPKKTQTLAIIMTDIDMPRDDHYYHWALFNLPPKLRHTPAKQPDKAAKNSWGKAEYQPPCPRYGTHHYQIKLYALDKPLTAEAQQSAVAMRKQMRHHIVASTKIIGKVQSPVSVP